MKRRRPKPKTKKKIEKLKFAVLGAGHGGLAMAGHLAIMGFDVNLYNRTKERVDHINDRGGIEVDGVVQGFGTPNLATSNIKDAIEDVDVIMVVVPAYGHSFMAKKSAKYLQDGQIIVLNPGRTCGVFEFYHVLEKEGSKAKVIVAETQTFIYVSRHVEFARAHIFDIKNSVPTAALPAYKTPEVLELLNQAYPQFVSATNVLETSFDNIGAIFHPIITLLNTARIEDEHVDFQYYLDGVTQSVAKVLERADNERVSVGTKLGVHLHSAREWLYLAYDSPGKTLFEAIHATPGYKGVMAPATLTHRYVLEDVPMSLVPMVAVGEHVGLKMPTLRSFIHLASIIHDTDFWVNGRTIEKMGLEKMSVRAIRLFALQGRKR
jgi:opine dehydrogenase